MKPHYIDNDIAIHKIKCGPYDNNAYILVCLETNESIIIDTPSDPSVVVALASTTSVKSIVITHNHMDHLLGFDEVTSAMDNKSEEQFIYNVQKIFEDKTVILITHNRDHAKLFDKVLDLNNLN